MSEAKEIADQMREKYGLDKPFFIQYIRWVAGFLKGDFGYSFKYRKPVFEVIWARLAWTFLIAFCCLAFAMSFGLMVGIYSATHQYRQSDIGFTILSFIGLLLFRPVPLRQCKQGGIQTKIPQKAECH